MRSILLVALAASIVPSLHAQDAFQCKANDPVELQRHFANDPTAFVQAQQAKASLDAHTASFERGGGSFVIPVVFHVIHNDGTENIGDDQVIDAIRVLNEDYNRLNPDWTTVRPEFLDIVADVGIEFRLAHKDPEGNCTNGITRTKSILTFEGDFGMTQLIHWPRESYLNIWIAASANGAAGYTYYPSTLDGWPAADGIVVKHEYVGSFGTGSPYRARVLSHEVGHWLNLMHCWGNSNSPGLDDNCFEDDDVDDTPLTKGWTSCSTSGSSCGSPLDNVQNYMEYSYCCKMFTLGQSERMLAALTSPIADRQNLWQSDNLHLTGVDGPGELCAARFAADRRQVCTGGQVQFTDQSYSGVSEWNWSFPGGIPNNSNEQSPFVSYSEPGLYPVTLTIGDGTNELSATSDAYIHVFGDPGLSVPWSEGFESVAAIPDAKWDLYDPGEDGGFAVTSTAAFTGTRSVRLSNSALKSGQVDHLLSPSVDLSNAGGAILRFRHAFARRSPIDNDGLFVWVSNDCGETWVLRKVMHAIGELLTGGVVPGVFIPSSDQWGQSVISNIGPTLCSSTFRVRFEFRSEGGNDLFLDDINIVAVPVGIDEINGQEQEAYIYRDAASGQMQLSLRLDGGGRVALEVVDMLGRSVGLSKAVVLPAGATALMVPVDETSPGSYVLRLTVGDRSRSMHFLVE